MWKETSPDIEIKSRLVGHFFSALLTGCVIDTAAGEGLDVKEAKR